MEKSKFRFLILSTFSLLLFLLSIFFLSLPVSAASGSNTSIPFNIYNTFGYGEYSNINSIFDVLDKDTFIAIAESGLSGQTYSSYIAYISDVGNNPFSGNPQDIYVVFVLDPFVNYNVSNDLDFGTTSIIVSGSKIYQSQIRYQWDDGGTYYMRQSGNVGGGNPTRTFFGTPQVISKTLRQGTFNYSPNYPFFSYGLSDDGVLSSNGVSVIIDHEVQVINSGSSTPPDFHGSSHSQGFLSSNYPNGTNAPSNVPPTITINNYTWTTSNPPSFDDTSILDAIKSTWQIINYLFGWLADNLKGEFQNLVSNIKNIGDYISHTIQYYGDLIVQNIQALAQNIYDNFVSLFEQFFSNFVNFFNIVKTIYELGLDDNGNFSLLTLAHNLFVPDSSDLSDVLIDHDIFGVSVLAADLTSFVNTYKYHLENDTPLYTLTLGQFTLFGVVLGPYSIDFSWYLNYKNIGDSIISAFLIFGYFMWLFARLPYWMRGQQGDVTNLTREVNK